MTTVDDVKRVLRLVEWRGYDTDSGERACPCCEVWLYQPKNSVPIHGYACALTTAIDAPMEEGIKKGEI